MKKKIVSSLVIILFLFSSFPSFIEAYRSSPAAYNGVSLFLFSLSSPEEEPTFLSTYENNGIVPELEKFIRGEPLTFDELQNLLSSGLLSDVSREWVENVVRFLENVPPDLREKFLRVEGLTPEELQRALEWENMSETIRKMLQQSGYVYLKSPLENSDYTETVENEQTIEKIESTSSQAAISPKINENLEYENDIEIRSLENFKDFASYDENTNTYILMDPEIVISGNIEIPANVVLTASVVRILSGASFSVGSNSLSIYSTSLVVSQGGWLGAFGQLHTSEPGGEVNVGVSELEVYGNLIADGGAGGRYGGNGGNIHVVCDSLVLGGRISANGGQGSVRGEPGSGGSVSIYFKHIELLPGYSYDALPNGSFTFIPTTSPTWKDELEIRSLEDFLNNTIYSKGTYLLQAGRISFSGRVDIPKNLSVNATDRFEITEEGYLKVGGQRAWNRNGGSVLIQSPEIIVKGTLSASGLDYFWWGAGHYRGDGGTITLEADNLTITGNMSTSGGYSHDHVPGGRGGSITISAERGAIKGIVTADGGRSFRNRGGNGGTISIHMSNFALDNTISANAGRGHYQYGPGNGGKIEIEYENIEVCKDFNPKTMPDGSIDFVPSSFPTNLGDLVLDDLGDLLNSVVEYSPENKCYVVKANELRITGRVILPGNLIVDVERKFEITDSGSLEAGGYWLWVKDGYNITVNAETVNIAGSLTSKGRDYFGWSERHYTAGDGGKITINATELQSGTISAEGGSGSFFSDSGDGGEVSINASNVFIGGDISVKGGSYVRWFGGRGGQGGNIYIYSSNLTLGASLFVDGGVGTYTNGPGDGGTITIYYRRVTTNDGFTYSALPNGSVNFIPLSVPPYQENLIIQNIGDVLNNVTQKKQKFRLKAKNITVAGSFALPHDLVIEADNFEVKDGVKIEVGGKWRWIKDAFSMLLKAKTATIKGSIHSNGRDYFSWSYRNYLPSAGGQLHILIENLTVKGVIQARGGKGEVYVNGSKGGVVSVVTRQMIVNGTISAKGGDGRPDYWYGGKGGDGGNVEIAFENIQIDGLVSAQGGPGSHVSGPGRGGEVRVYYSPTFDIEILRPHVSANPGGNIRFVTVDVLPFNGVTTMSYTPSLYVPPVFRGRESSLSIPEESIVFYPVMGSVCVVSKPLSSGKHLACLTNPEDVDTLTRSWWFTVIRDNVPPVSRVMPFEGDAYWKTVELGGSFTITAEAEDDFSGVKSVELWYRYSLDNWTDTVAWKKQGWRLYDVDAEGSDGWSWEFTPERYGYYEFISVASDWAGNREDKEQTFAENLAEARCRVARDLVRVAVILARPQDVPENKEHLYNRTYIQKKWVEATNGLGGLKSYYDEVSYGVLAIRTIDIYDNNGQLFILLKSYNYYGSSNNPWPTQKEFVIDAIKVADGQVNYNNYDIIIAFPGPLRPNGIAFVGEYTTSDEHDGMYDKAKNYIFLHSGELKDLAHEVAHQLGRIFKGQQLPDLYSIAPNPWGEVDHWGLMDLPKNVVHLSSWSKEWLGLLKYETVGPWIEQKAYGWYSSEEVNILYWENWVEALPMLGYDGLVFRHTIFDTYVGGDVPFWSKSDLILEVRTPDPEYSQWDNVPSNGLVLYQVDKITSGYITSERVNVIENSLKIGNSVLIDGRIRFGVLDEQAGPKHYRLKVFGAEENTYQKILAILYMIPYLFRTHTFLSENSDALPDLDLHAYTYGGQHVGMNYKTGKYEIEIPGAVASGDLYNGSEWILVPENVEVYFIVSSKDVERYLETRPEILENENGIYALDIRYYDENGNGFLCTPFSEQIAPRAEVFVDFAVAQNPDGTYSVKTEPGLNLLGLQAWQVAIDNIPDEVFINRSANRERALKNKFGAVFKMFEANNYRGAINKLEKDILEKLDADGRADWVKQPVLVNEIKAFIGLLRWRGKVV